ncbi:MAG: ABC transporter substrate-binding protein [Chloroflexi bacterium]|nr:ABC transporter substrate-binding protein [Chloroflexota bacterium]
MLRKKSLIVASCFTILGLLVSAGGGCAPAVAPTPTPKPPATAPTKAPAAAPTAAPTAKPAAPAPTPKPAAEQSRYGGILTAGIGGDPPSLDIHQEDSSFTYAITAATYNRLLKPDPAGWPELKPVPDLATSWQVSPDGKVYTFHLAKGAKFHDGSPVSAEDVKFTLDRIRNPQRGMAKSPRRQQLDRVTSIDTPDDYTVKITLSRPQSYFPTLMAVVYYAVMPKRVVLDKGNDMRKTVVGSGPFKLKSYSTGVGWELERNPDYFVKGRPYLDGVKGYIIVDSFTRFAALRTRNILWYAPFPYMTVSQTKTIEQTLSDKIALEWGAHPAWYGVVFNLSKPPWSDVRVRQAVSMALDRKKVVAVALEGAGVPAMVSLPTAEWRLPEDEMMKVPGYAKPDPEGAKRLLAEVGLSQGFKAEVLVRGIKPTTDIAVVVKDAGATIGIDFELKMAETATFNDARYRKAFDVLVGGSSAKLDDPDLSMGDWYVTDAEMNWAAYSNSHYDELYAKQSQTVDPAERRKIVWEMQRALLRDVPIAITSWIRVPYAWWREVKGFTVPVGFSYSFQFEDIWLAR